MMKKIILTISIILNVALLGIVALFIIIELNRPSCYHYEEYKYLLEYSHELIKNSSVHIDTTSAYLNNYKLYTDDSTGEKSYIFDINDNIRVVPRTSEFSFIIVTDKKDKIKYIGWDKP